MTTQLFSQSTKAPPDCGTCFDKYLIEMSYFKGRLTGQGLHATSSKPTKPLTFSATRSETMSTLKTILCTAILVLAMSTTGIAKSGTISTTKTGVISTTRTGTISTTTVGTVSNSRTGTISTTRTGVISTTRTETTVSLDRAWFFELLLTLYSPWF